MLVTRIGPSEAPWFVWVLIVGIVVAAVIASLVQSIGTAVTGLAILKSLMGTGASLAGRPLRQRLSGPVDLVGDNVAAGLLMNPLLALISTIIAAVQKARQAGGTDIPRQYLTERLVPIWAAGLLRMPAGTPHN